MFVSFVLATNIVLTSLITTHKLMLHPSHALLPTQYKGVVVLSCVCVCVCVMCGVCVCVCVCVCVSVCVCFLQTLMNVLPQPIALQIPPVPISLDHLSASVTWVTSCRMDSVLVSAHPCPTSIMGPCHLLCNSVLQMLMNVQRHVLYVITLRGVSILMEATSVTVTQGS